MRFKAKVINEKTFANIVQTLEKVDKKGVIRLHKERIEFISQQFENEEIQVFAKIPTSLIFSEFRIQSKSNNEIYLEVQLKNLAKALKTANNALMVIVKLTKKHQIGYLSFEIRTRVTKGKDSNSIVTIVQDVPIRIILQDEVQNRLVEPDFSGITQEPLQIGLPKLKDMKSVVDKMKSSTKHEGGSNINVDISASPTGQFRLVVNSTLVSIRTIYKNLNVKSMGSREPQANEIYTSDITVKLKALGRFLFAYLVNPVDVDCIFIDNTALVMDVSIETTEQNRGYLTYYIPAVQI
ncbi:hypothetical protein ABK040_006566 [Willaertia magna]